MTGIQLSEWDGAHHNLVRAVKKVMNDPGSFEHVETVYWDMKDHLVVRMTFRGTNAFGAVVPQTVKAWVDLEGNMQKWEWYNPSLTDPPLEFTKKSAQEPRGSAVLCLHCLCNCGIV